MSFLTLPGGIPDFSQAVISFWFRVPEESISAAKAAYSGGVRRPPLFDGIIPLMVMGATGSFKDFDTTISEVVSAKNVYPTLDKGISKLTILESDIDHVTIQNDINIGYTFTFDDNSQVTDAGYIDVSNTTIDDEPTPTDPVCIGVDCSSSTPVLYIRFETGIKPSVAEYDYELSSVDPAINKNPGAGDWAGFSSGTIITRTESTPPFLQTELLNNVELVYIPGGVITIPGVWNFVSTTDAKVNRTGSISSRTIPIGGADKWHHVLVSLDLTDIKTRGQAVNESFTKVSDYVNESSRLFVALDDVNYVKDQLSEYWPFGSDDDNAVITEEAMMVANKQQGINHNPAGPPGGTPVGGVPSYSLTGMDIPCSGQSMGFPAPVEFMENVYRVEMAEFQMWTGITLDTGKVDTRRHFIDVDGKPVPPDQKEDIDAGIPAGSIEFMGRPPDVMLHKSASWINGRNSGSTGIDADGTVIPEGQFEPTGGIEKYKPDPSLIP